MPVYKTLDHDFFKSWTHEMSYVLGFFAADGTMVKNKRGAHFVEFHITDKMVIKQIRSAFGSNHKISARERPNGWKTLYRLQLGSKQLFNDLVRIGFSQAKSTKMRLPNIPKEYLGDFIRGYFDGDGCVYFKKHHVKGRAKMKWIFHTRFTSGSKKFLSDLHNILNKQTSGGYIYSKKKGKKVSGYELVFSHRDSLALFELMYNNGTCNLFLERKFKIFKNAVETLYGVRT